MSLTGTFVDQNDVLLSLKKALKDELYEKSPLRNKFQVRPLDEGEILWFKCVSEGHVINEEGVKISRVKKPAIYVPLFEISCYIKLHDDFLKIEKQKLLDSLTKQAKILKKEKELYEQLKKFKGKGIFVIRIDLQVLQVLCYNVKKSKDFGFAIFEQVGVAKIN